MLVSSLFASWNQQSGHVTQQKRFIKSINCFLTVRHNFLESEKCFYKNKDIGDLLINFVLTSFRKKRFYRRHFRQSHDIIMAEQLIIWKQKSLDGAQWNRERKRKCFVVNLLKCLFKATIDYKTVVPQARIPLYWQERSLLLVNPEEVHFDTNGNQMIFSVLLILYL